MKKHISMILAAVILVSSVGCGAALFGAGAAAGAGAYAFDKGRLTATEEADFESTWNASIQALEEAGYPISEVNKEMRSGKITARAEGDKRVVINLEGTATDTTRVNIRVGTFGDEVISSSLHKSIHENLNGAAAGER